MDAFPEIPGYKLEKKLGQGRLTNAYLAIKEETEQKVVIKILLPELVRTEDEKFPQRFLYEARRAAKLDHPNIVKIFDVGETPDNYYYIMEYLPECLSARIANRDLPSGFESGREVDISQDSALTETKVQEVLDIFRQFIDALDYANQEEIIHRDIRPENIFFRDEAGFITPVIVDFCMQQVAAISTTVTERRLIIRDLHYTSPEAILKNSMDITSDFYSLGIVLFEMLSGRVPYEADDPKTLENLHKTAPIPQLPAQLSRFQPLLERLLAKTKEDRAQNSAELMLLIEELNEDLIPDLMEESGKDEMGYEVGNETGEELETEIKDEIRVKRDPGFGQEIEIASEIPESTAETETENLELGEEIKKEFEEQKRQFHEEDLEQDRDIDLYPGTGERAPRHPFELKVTKDTGAGVTDLLSKLKNPRIFIPAAVVIVIIIVLAVVFLKPSDKSGAGKPEGAGQEQDISEDSEASTTGDSKEVQFTRKLKQAQRGFELGEYEKAQQLLAEAEKIKSTPEIETLKKQLQEKIVEKQDDIVFQKALKAGDAASLEEYLSKYPTGLHAAAAREKVNELTEREKKINEEKRKWAASRVTLRSSPQTLEKSDVRTMVKKRGFFEKYYNSSGDFLNHYEMHSINNQKVIIDYATGLMWHQSGSERPMKYDKTQSWIQELNRQKYAGFSDWRLPTLEEVASLMESQESRDALYIDSIFSKDQNHTWTADIYDKNRAWAVDIFGGDFNPVEVDYESFVRPVRSVK